VSHQYPKGFYNCAGCNFWSGMRQVDKSGTFVTVESSTEKGNCLFHGGSREGQERQASVSCGNWQAWVALK